MSEVYEMPDGLVTGDAVACAEAWYEKAMQLQATNKHLLEALGKIAGNKNEVNYSQDDWMYQAIDDIEIAEKAITNAKQVMPDEPTA